MLAKSEVTPATRAVREVAKIEKELTIVPVDFRDRTDEPAPPSSNVTSRRFFLLEVAMQFASQVLILILALFAFAVPVLAADMPAPLEASTAFPANTVATNLPSPPPVTWEVWGFKWDGSQWIKQPTHCLKTTDLQKAIAYSNQLFSYAGWNMRDNVPRLCATTITRYDNTVPDNVAPPAEAPEAVTYSVWAYKLTDGKWIKNDEYSWDTSKWRSRDVNDADGRLVALDLVKRINAVPGWYATTNAPACDLPLDQRWRHEGYAIGSTRYYYSHRYRSRGGSSSNDNSWVQAQWEADRNQQQLNNDAAWQMQQMQQSIDMMNQALQNTTPP
jgi:hypothetical protein